MSHFYKIDNVNLSKNCSLFIFAISYREAYYSLTDTNIFISNYSYLHSYAGFLK